MSESLCPECDSEVKLGKTVKLGQQARCGSCGADLEVVSLTPVELDWVLEEEEFDDDDFDYNDEDEEFELDYDEEFDD